jgi:putative protease
MKKKKTAAKAKKTAKKKSALKKRPAKKAVKKTKKAAKKQARKPAAAPKTIVPPPANGKLLGRVEDFFSHINVIALTLNGSLAKGAKLHILGHTTNLEQAVDSMQINHQPVNKAPAKSSVGIKVNDKVRRGDYVYLVP